MIVRQAADYLCRSVDGRGLAPEVRIGRDNPPAVFRAFVDVGDVLRAGATAGDVDQLAGALRAVQAPVGIGVWHSSDVSLPQFVCSPVRRYPHRLQGHIWKSVKQCEKSFAPSGLWGGFLDQLIEQSQDDEHSTCRNRPRPVPAGIVLLVRQDRLNGQFPVPQARMVGAHVSDVVEGLKPRKQDRTRKADALRDRISGSTLAHLKQGKHPSEGHHLARRPDRQVWKFVVRPFEVLCENLAAVAGLLTQIVQKFLMAILVCPFEIRDVCVAKRPRPHCELVDQCGSHGNLDAFNRVHHDQPQLPIESVSFPNDVEMGVWGERAIRPLERMPISAKPVVTDRAQSANQHGAVSDHHSTRLKQRRLVLVGQRWFVELHGEKAKKDPPRLCMSITDRGRAGVLRKYCGNFGVASRGKCKALNNLRPDLASANGLAGIGDLQQLACGSLWKTMRAMFFRCVFSNQAAFSFIS